MRYLFISVVLMLLMTACSVQLNEESVTATQEFSTESPRFTVTPSVTVAMDTSTPIVTSRVRMTRMASITPRPTFSSYNSNTAQPSATRTPRPTMRPTQSNRTNRRPGNCSTAVAMGLSSSQAGNWSHLDRDGDGVACYGD